MVLFEFLLSPHSMAIIPHEDLKRVGSFECDVDACCSGIKGVRYELNDEDFRWRHMLVARAKVVNDLSPIDVGNMFAERQGPKEWDRETINLIDAVYVCKRRLGRFPTPLGL